MRKTNAFYVRRDGNPFPFPRSRIRSCRSALRRCTSAGAIPKSLPASCPKTPPCGKTSGTSPHGAEKYMRNAAATCIFAPRSKPPKRPGARGTTAASGPCAGSSTPRRAWAGASVPLGTGKPPCSPAPFGLRHETFRGHEFHWSDIELHRDYPPPVRSPHPLRRRKSRGRLRQRQSRVCPSLLGK